MQNKKVIEQDFYICAGTVIMFKLINKERTNDNKWLTTIINTQSIKLPMDVDLLLADQLNKTLHSVLSEVSESDTKYLELSWKSDIHTNWDAQFKSQKSFDKSLTTLLAVDVGYVHPMLGGSGSRYWVEKENALITYCKNTEKPMLNLKLSLDPALNNL